MYITVTNYFVDGLRLCVRTAATNGPIVLPPDDDMSMKPWLNDDTDRGKPNNSEKNLYKYHFSTTNPIWIEPGAKLGLRGGRPATNRLSHGTAPLKY
jgi:hypothetical protein